jgi:pimeloyl-ACP methyl ester carboxylesterase
MSPRQATSNFDATHPSTGLLKAYDATPHIDSIQQLPPSSPGGSFYVKITGTHFGSALDSVAICASPFAGNAHCTPAGDFSTTQIGAPASETSTPWTYSVVWVLLTPLATAFGPHCVQVSSLGAGGSQFSFAPNAASTDASNCVDTSTFTISGQVTFNGAALSGVGISLSGGTGFTQTDANGQYSLTLPGGGSYTVTPSLLGYVFTPRPPPTLVLIDSNPNQTANFTAARITTVYLLHGITQSASAMAALQANLTSLSTGIDLGRFQVDAGFTFSCSPAGLSCSANCSSSSPLGGIHRGGQELAQYILQNPPPGDIILIGYSMGGLIARDMIAYNYQVLNNHVLDGRKVLGLITLGTPHLGYPYSSIDDFVPQNCPGLVQDMAGSWQPQLTPPPELFSTFLNDLTRQWLTASYAGYWMAAAGESCTTTIRTTGALPRGCLPQSPSSRSDGVVCRDSAVYSGDFAKSPFPNLPLWEDPDQRYVHTNAVGGWGTAGILCRNSGNPADYPQLFDPPINDTLFANIKATINGH